jgi:hypothetical protein
MSKAHRGKGIRDQFARGRGVCPVCQRDNVKIIYEQESAGQKFKICKTCRASIKNGKKKLPVVEVVATERLPNRLRQKLPPQRQNLKTIRIL